MTLCKTGDTGKMCVTVLLCCPNDFISAGMCRLSEEKDVCLQIKILRLETQANQKPRFLTISGAPEERHRETDLP